MYAHKFRLYWFGTELVVGLYITQANCRDCDLVCYNDGNECKYESFYVLFVSVYMYRK